MNKQKISGSYYTPDFLANFIMRHVMPSLDAKQELNVLEPSVGDGAFINAFLKGGYADKFKKTSFTSIEKNTVELDKARKIANRKKTESAKFLFRNENFLEWQKNVKKAYSLIIGNPPYVRRRYIHADDVVNCENIHNAAGLKIESIKNIWSAFLVRSCQLLNSTGIIAFVLPAELLQSNYADSLRHYLVSVFEKIEVFTFNDLLFDAIGQDTVLLIGYKSAVEKGTFYTNIENIQELKDMTFTLSLNESVQQTQTKWTHHILDPEEINLLNELKGRFSPLGTYCESKPGIVTAANSFFIINDETVNKHDLNNFAKPIIQKGFFVNGKASFDQSDLIELIASKRPSKFLNFATVQKDNIPNNVIEYLKLGINEDIPSRYKCLKRQQWYVVPNVPEAGQGFFFKRSHHYPKLLKNEAGVLVTDSGYQVDMKADYQIDALIFSFYNSLTIAFSEMLGRYYGGGVLELTPREFKALPLPYTTIDTRGFNSFKKRFKNKADIDEVLVANDQIILRELYGLSEDTVRKIQVIKKKLTEKRMRKKTIKKSNESANSNVTGITLV